MKILVLSQYFWPENFRVNDLVSELVSRGHDVTVLTGLPNYPDGQILGEFKADPERFKTYCGARVVRVPLLPRGRGGLRLIMNYLSFVVTASTMGVWKLRGEAFDKIFVFEPSPITVGLPAIVLRWFKKAPIVFWVLDLWPDTLRAVGVITSQRLLDCVGVLVKLVYRYSDTILVQSRSFVQHVLRYCSEPAKVRYFPSWAEGQFAARDGEDASELSEFKDDFKIVFAGNIGEAQDFPAILNAAEATRSQANIKWLLVGDGRMAEWVRKEIQHRGLEQTVVMLGRFPLERMPSFYQAADALLVTLKPSEVFSMTIPGKVQSYLAAGKPLLGMLNGEGSTVISDAGAGFACKASDAQGLASLASQMADMPAQARESMGRAGHAYYLANFERGKLMDEFEQILDAAHLPVRGF